MVAMLLSPPILGIWVKFVGLVKLEIRQKLAKKKSDDSRVIPTFAVNLDGSTVVPTAENDTQAGDTDLVLH